MIFLYSGIKGVSIFLSNFQGIGIQKISTNRMSWEIEAIPNFGYFLGYVIKSELSPTMEAILNVLWRKFFLRAWNIWKQMNSFIFSNKPPSFIFLEATDLKGHFLLVLFRLNER